ncbi:MAG: hypothetical protein V4540_13370 [Pseudomonadota bacterium]
MFDAEHVNTGADTFQYSLYAGDGVGGALLAQQTVTFAAGTAYRQALLMADFSAVSLTVGGSYTLAAMLPGGALPGAGTSSSVSIDYAGANAHSNPYTGGRFYFVGSTYDQNDPASADRDIAFRVASVPEADGYLMAMVGIAVVGSTCRRRRRQP